MPPKTVRPWKKNLRQLPNAILVKIAKTDGPLIAAVTRRISADDIRRGLFDHLSIRIGAEGIEFTSPVIPPPNVGRYSERNVRGWEVTRTDLPKITKSFYVETPNFGDWSRGSHTVVHDRLVYQKEYHEPRDIALSIEVLRTHEGFDETYLVKFAAEYVFDRKTPEFREDLLFILNILQENVGAVDIHPSNITRDEFLKTLTLDWEIFPPGSVEEVVRLLAKKMRKTPRTGGVLRDRIEAFSKLKPKAYIQGSGGLNSYVGALFAEDLVVFENVRYGNALYILYDDWRLVSQRSRSDLVRGTDAEFDRIVHGPLWKEHLADIIRSRLRGRR